VLGAAPLLTPLLEGSVADPAHMPMRLVARYLAPFVGREGVAHLLALARTIRREDFESIALESVRAPTLVIRGEADGWVDGDVAKRLVIALLPHARLVELPGVGRLVPEEDPEALADLLTDLTAERWGDAARAESTPADAFYSGADAADLPASG
jgi:pimeloyl-ACP methyl ester carboxylesterase